MIVLSTISAIFAGILAVWANGLLLHQETTAMWFVMFFLLFMAEGLVAYIILKPKTAKSHLLCLGAYTSQMVCTSTIIKMFFGTSLSLAGLAGVSFLLALVFGAFATNTEDVEDFAKESER